MHAIVRRGACRVYDISAELSITVGGTSKLVDRIEASGYCGCCSNPDDRRSSLIELMSPGQRVLVEATGAFEDEFQVRLVRLGALPPGPGAVRRVPLSASLRRRLGRLSRVPATAAPRATLRRALSRRGGGPVGPPRLGVARGRPTHACRVRYPSNSDETHPFAIGHRRPRSRQGLQRGHSAGRARSVVGS